MDIPKANEKPHLDIEAEIQQKQNGLFTCTLRINDGVIVDVTIVEYANIHKYAGLIKQEAEEFLASQDNQQRDCGKSVRIDNNKRGIAKRNVTA